jgi:hypothetical protein
MFKGTILMQFYLALNRFLWKSFRQLRGRTEDKHKNYHLNSKTSGQIISPALPKHETGFLFS